MVPSDMTRRNGHKHKKFLLNTRNNFFTVMVTKHWHRLPGGAVDSSALEIFTDIPRCRLCKLQRICVSRRLNQGISTGLFQLLRSCDSYDSCELQAFTQFPASHIIQLVQGANRTAVTKQKKLDGRKARSRKKKKKLPRCLSSP